MEDCCGVRPAISFRLFFAGCRIAHCLFAWNECDYADSMLPLLDGASKSLPSMERKDVLAWLDIGLSNSFGHEPLEDCRIVHRRLASTRVGQRFLLHFGFRHLTLLRC